MPRSTRFPGGESLWEGDLPGVIDTGVRRIETQEETPGDPTVAPPLPGTFPAQNLSDYILGEMKKIDALVENKFIREKIIRLWRIITSHQFLAVHQVPWESAPFRSIPLHVVAGDSAGAATYEDIAVLSVEQGRYGVIRWIGHDTSNAISGGAGVGDVWAAATLTWRIGIRPSQQAADASVLPYNGFDGFFKQIGQIEDPTPVPYLFVPGGYTIAFQASGPAGAVTGLSARMVGWTWGIEDMAQSAASSIFGVR